MKVIIFGGTGSIGRALVQTLIAEKLEVFVVSRNSQKANLLFDNKIDVIQWDTNNKNVFQNAFTGQYAIINLAGENIGAKLWTNKQKSKILDSRILITSKISEIVNKSEVKPRVFIQASASGYYGSSLNQEFDETSPQGSGFLSDVCAQWEHNLKLDDTKSTREVIMRTGLVLDANEGLIQKMKISFKYFVGGYFGNGKQWMSWIHIQDEIRAVIFLLKNEQAEGVFNLVSPKPERMRKFCNIFGAIQFRLSWLHIPAFLIKLLPSQMGQELFLASQKVKPVRLQEAGFEFQFNKLEDALRDLLITKEDG